MTTNEITAEEFGVSADRGASTLRRLVMLRAQAKEIEAEVKEIEAALKMELTSDPDPIISDGVVAVLRERRSAAEFDLITMSKHEDEHHLLVEAAREGLLTARVGAIRAQKGHSEAADVLLNKYEMPGASTFVLVVEEA